MSEERPDFTWDEFAAGNGPGGGPPPRDADRFKPCFRHPDRSTGISCQRCDRPICGECMVPASVGFQCPVCVAEQQMTARPVTNRVGRRIDGGGARGRTLAGIRLTGGPRSTTVMLMIAIAVVGVADLLGRGAGSILLGFSAAWIGEGQLWRLVTGILVSGGLLNLLISLLFLWLVGRSVEAEIGRWRMLAILVIGGIGASAALILFFPVDWWPLTFAAILGLLAAVAVMKFKFGEDVRGDLILLGLMVAFSVVMGSAAGWVSQLGAIVAGAAAGAVLAYAPRASRTRWQAIGLGAVAVVFIGLALARLMI
jgi:membrane associated rhomboid family serine protease